ncbi:DUF4097 family beta strand repeat protein [Weissella confusa]|uniref:DUF4097 family beta strand repeat protein n=1 Tax=Weissella confusa TaxID=1583 RepID=A0A923SQ35_WEICO|nr:DUF4097 family beta strand repeat protein [Weissella confusa]
MQLKDVVMNDGVVQLNSGNLTVQNAQLTGVNAWTLREGNLDVTNMPVPGLQIQANNGVPKKAVMKYVHIRNYSGSSSLHDVETKNLTLNNTYGLVTLNGVKSPETTMNLADSQFSAKQATLGKATAVELDVHVVASDKNEYRVKGTVGDATQLNLTDKDGALHIRYTGTQKDKYRVGFNKRVEHVLTV